MNDADETGDCMRSVRDSAQAGLTPAILGGPVRKRWMHLGTCRWFHREVIPAYFRHIARRLPAWDIGKKSL